MGTLPTESPRLKTLDNEVFALRDHECIQVFEDRPESGRFIAAMVRSVPPPPGPMLATCEDGAPVEAAAILAAVWRHFDQRWVWTHLSPASKRNIGDVMLDGGCERDRWYFVVITDAPTT